MTLREAALNYCKHGWAIFPITPHEKAPPLVNWREESSDDPKQVKVWWDEAPTANIGLDCGKSKIIVIDVDIKQGGMANWNMLCEEHDIDTDTLKIITPSQGRHIFYLAPDVEIGNSRNLEGHGIDVRGVGGYVVLPPSVTKKGRYKTEAESESINNIKPLPQVLIELLTAKKKVKEEPHEDQPIPAGQRNNALASIAGAMRRQGLSAAGIESALLVENQTRCDPPLPDDEIRTIAHSIGQYAPEKDTAGLDECPLTDMGNARRMINLYGKHIRYCHTTGKWMMWKKELWMSDRIQEIRLLVYETLRDAEQIMEDKKKIKTYQNTTHINGALTEAKSMVAITANDMDTKQYLLNTANGTLNLNDLKLQRHNPDDLISKIAPVSYTPTAKSKKWEDFLGDIMEGNEALIKFLQRMTGYAITGSVTDQVFFILHGSGANGKSTFFQTVAAALGDYATEAAADTFLQKRGDHGIPNDLVRIKGRRLVLASETDKGRRLSEALVKRLSGGEKVVARELFKEFFEFENTAKLWLITNHKPNIYDNSFAMWRRVMLIPFNYQIPSNLQDKKFGEKLRATELEAVFAWVVEGYQMWRDDGLNPPMEVLAATRDYQDEMDYLGGFMAEHCIEDAEAVTASSVLYSSYKTWCEENGEKTISNQKFGRLLSDRGFARFRETVGKKRILYKGLRLDTIGHDNQGELDTIGHD